MMTRYYSELNAPIGTLLLVGSDAGLIGLYMENQRNRPSLHGIERSDRAFRAVREQLKAYFAGVLHRFDVPLAGEGTPFQQTVWQALQKIPFGATVTYRELAGRIGNRRASRAVGLANSRNPVAIIVPCHRVVGANGALTGYAGGIGRKRWLLEHERRHVRAPRPA